MTSTFTRRVVIAVVAMGAGLLVLPQLVTSDSRVAASRDVMTDVAPTAQPTPPMSQGLAAAADAVDASRQRYAIAVDDLAGLPPNAGPGTALDLWVTWEPPVTRGPKLQRLLRGVILEDIAEPVTPDGPYVALLSVASNRMSDLMWADRYGAISVSLPAPAL